MTFWDFADKHFEGLAASTVIIIGIVAGAWLIRYLNKE